MHMHSYLNKYSVYLREHLVVFELHLCFKSNYLYYVLTTLTN